MIWRSCFLGVVGRSRFFCEWAIVFLSKDWAIVFFEGDWAIAFLWVVGRSCFFCGWAIVFFGGWLGDHLTLPQQ